MRATKLRLAAAFIGAAFALSATAHAAEPTNRESFEEGMGGWEADTDGKARDWLITRSTEHAVDGTTSLSYYLDGRNDEGTIWVERAFTARPNTTVSVTTSFWLHNKHSGQINQWMVVGFADTRDPETERDMVPPIDRTNHKVGWTKHTFTKKVRTDRTGTVWVAAGIRATWEGRRTYYFDLVETTITPLSPQGGAATG